MPFMPNLELARSIFSVIFKYILLTILLLAPLASFGQSQNSVNLAQQMYVAYYGRAGDPGGVNYWAGQFDESSNLDAVLSNFGNSQEYSDNFGSLSHQQLVSGLFQQMFNRSPDTEGLEFYVGRLQSGQATLASIAKQIADGTQGNDKLSLDNKIAVAKAFTSRVDSQDFDYASADISSVRTLLAAVTSSASSVEIGLTAVSNWLPQSSSDSNVFMTTNFGVIEIELFPEQAPVTVANFLAYIESGFYEGLIFHRVIYAFMIQGGGFDMTGSPQSTFPPIELEADNGLSNLRGTIAMARTSVPDSATSQFFINHVDNAFLDSTGSDDGYAVFGKVVKGMDVVDAIANLDTGSVGSFTDLPVEPVIIQSIVLAPESENSDGDGAENNSSLNHSPIANAGPDKNVNTFEAVYLNGGDSSDDDGDILTYSWTYLTAPTGSDTLLYSTNSATPYFTPDVAGTYTFELQVNDGTTSSMIDKVSIVASSTSSQQD